MRCVVVGLCVLLTACQRPSGPAATTSLGAGERPAASIRRAPGFTLPTAAGSSLTLSSLRGKYVLLDFWASGCVPCAAESPNLHKIYGQFHSRGLEIVRVSLDEDPARWHAAVAADTMAWLHVSDLRGWRSPVAQAYQVRILPYSVLLSPEGRVLATNLRGRALGQKISGYIPLD
ncbi:TlpA family protein disulfide reductase [Hymenobacter perfusus]|uniref:TlpA family protein disulfide reductase n=1 Tax=Hymenobacter perfusus TaxID=1236770 RepID=A0A3R9MNR6_9BACT|nr:TlpA disulfide reductase family protein [Hymenobacter perfusus]RSK44790.1 TlpA family protein disulfide reductase [Hymenobacter perfusus]